MGKANYASAGGDEDVLKENAGNKEKDAGKDENELLEIDLDVINPRVDLDDGADVNGFVLLEENIKEILDTSCLNLKGQEGKEDAIDSEIVKQKIDAELDYDSFLGICFGFF